MARAKKHVEEFNPWPPFVDVFSSVILVLLLFILIIIVNLTYYMKFNSKAESESIVASKTNNLTKGVDVTDMITMKKTVKPTADKGGNESLFSGGKSTGNAVVAAKDQSISKQNIKKINKKEILVSFNSKNIFIDKITQNKILSFIKDAKKSNKNAKIELSIANSTEIRSTTVARQISVARTLNIKNLIKKSNYKLSDISLKINNVKDDKYKNGYVRVKIIQ